MSSLKSSSSTSPISTSKRKRGNASALKHKERAQNFRSNKNKEIQAIRTLEVFFQYFHLPLRILFNIFQIPFRYNIWQLRNMPMSCFHW